MFSVYATPVNDVPVISAGPSSFTMNENSEHSIAFSNYTITDPDQVENYTFTNVRAMTGDTELAEVDLNTQIHPFDSETCCQHAENLFDDCFCGWCVHPESTGPVDLTKVECNTCIERWS